MSRNKISEKDLQTSTRLKNLEKQMTMTIKNFGSPMSIEKLKSFYKRRASIETTRSIVEFSENLLFDEHLNVRVQNYCSANPFATVTYEATGDIEIRIDGKYGEPSGDSVTCVNINPNELFYLEIDADFSESWTFTTSSIFIVEDGYPRNRFGITRAGTGNFSDWV